MNNRRNFIKLSALGGAAVITNACLGSTNEKSNGRSEAESGKKVTKPIVIATWDHGVEANAAAWKILEKGGNALDAVEAGVRVNARGCI